MNEIIANYTKIIVGLMALIVTVGYVTGHVTTDDLKVLIGIGLGVHAGVSGLTGIIGSGQPTTPK